MKEGWEYKKLGDICEILNGFAFKSSRYVSEGIRIIRITNVQKGRVEDNDPKYYPLSSKKEIERYLLREGDLLVSLTGNVGRVGRLSQRLLPAALNQRVACLRLKGNEVDKQYLYHFLNSDYFENICTKNSSGAAQLNLSTVWLSNYEIAIPSLSEQQSIVDYLDSAFAKIDAMKANAEKALNEAKALFQASLKEMLEPKEGWVHNKLGDVCNVVGGGTPDTKNKDYWSGNIPWATVSDMNCDVLKSTGYYITDKGLNESSSRIIKTGEIIIATRVGLGKVCKLAVDTAINQDLKGIIPKNNNILRDFIFYYFKHKTKYIVDNGIGATVKGVKIKFIEGLSFDYPSLSEQQSIVATLDSLKSKVDRLQENYDKISQECDALKQAILRQVFE
ncbi:restriction endonuclease subunit S [Xylanibacter brevis]|uniref:restriction endonuclease subunit S n=1 Tax=Xylanibacter brevis TaxID=83231 RepID=UPI0009DD3B12|nr:restriction endonuclease subunit S [Xylanibacter brevis]